MPRIPRALPMQIEMPPEQAKAWNERVAGVEMKLLRTVDLLADKYLEQLSGAESQAAAADVKRRQMANALKIWSKCPQRTCAHARACRGEPALCLDACLPALPPGTLAAYIATSRRRKKR